jgi:hypothetical protein
MTKASNSKRNLYRSQRKRDIAASLRTADEATKQAAIAHLGNASIPASTKTRRRNAIRKFKVRLVQEIKRREMDSLDHSEEDTNVNGKRDRDDDEEEEDEEEVSPSETSLSTRTGGGVGGVLVGQTECQIKFGDWFVQNGREALEGPFQAGYEKGREGMVPILQRQASNLNLVKAELERTKGDLNLVQGQLETTTNDLNLVQGQLETMRQNHETIKKYTKRLERAHEDKRTMIEELLKKRNDDQWEEETRELEEMRQEVRKFEDVGI